MITFMPREKASETMRFFCADDFMNQLDYCAFVHYDSSLVTKKPYSPRPYALGPELTEFLNGKAYLLYYLGTEMVVVVSKVDVALIKLFFYDYS